MSKLADFARRFAHIHADAQREAGRMADWPNVALLQRTGQHKSYPAGKPTSTWDSPLEKHKLVDTDQPFVFDKTRDKV